MRTLLLTVLTFTSLCAVSIPKNTHNHFKKKSTAAQITEDDIKKDKERRRQCIANIDHNFMKMDQHIEALKKQYNIA